MEYLIAKQLKMISLENFDQIFYETNYQNNYHDRLFIIYDKYLVISLIDLEEKNEKILEKFYENSPVIILPIEKIFYVTYDRIFLDIYHRESIYLRQYSDNIYFNPSNWLHERLMILNEQYRSK
jgi:DNA replicative helicase MCM subunit Mcm2 (Cdc46/Mcm family)